MPLGVPAGGGGSSAFTVKKGSGTVAILHAQAELNVFPGSLKIHKYNVSKVADIDAVQSLL
jgi:hypothetical protein